MQFISKSFSLSALFALALVAIVDAAPTGMDVIERDPAGLTSRNTTSSPVVKIMTDDEMDHWLSTTDANLTFVGGLSRRARVPNTLGRRDTTVTFCSSKAAGLCGGTCNVYTGGPTCLATPGTACLAATSDVGFCDKGGCKGSCNTFSTCGTKLEDGFCDTPGTNSVVVGGAPAS